VLAVATVVGVPVWLIRPFVTQLTAAIDWSWTLRHGWPLATAIALVAGLLLVAGLWRGARGRDARSSCSPRCFSPAPRGLPGNHFEWMFRPFPAARFTPVADTKDVPDKEPIFSVAHRGEALAFPIRRIGYHHLINTEVGRVPIVSTY
jgi:hypothetical protein